MEFKIDTYEMDQERRATARASRVNRNPSPLAIAAAMSLPVGIIGGLITDSTNASIPMPRDYRPQKLEQSIDNHDVPIIDVPQNPLSIINSPAIAPNTNTGRRRRKPKNTESVDDPEFWEKLTDQVERHEGFESEAYRDSRGILTVGYGTNLETLNAPRKLSEVGANYSMIASGRNVLTQEQASTLMETDLINAVKTARRIFPEYDSFPEQVKLTIPDMIYNLGEGKFRGFKRAIEAFKTRDFETAADEMKDSRWYDQVGNRSEYLVNLVREAT